MLKGLKGLIIGVVAGTALGVLFAPKKGEETRKEMKNEFKKGGSGLNTLKKTATDMGKDFQGSYNTMTKSEGFRKAEQKVKKHTDTLRREAQKLIKENVSSSTQRKVKKTLEKAKKALKDISNQ